MKIELDTASADWGKLGAFRVGDGVYRIPLPLPGDALRAVNVYAIVGDDELTIIDSGWGGIPETRVAFGSALAELGFEARAVRRSLITHAHRDHYTFATELRDDHGTTISLGEHERENIARAIQGDRGGLVGRLERAGASHLMQSSPGRPTNTPWSIPDRWLVDGEIVTLPGVTDGLEVIHTPGHTRGHVVYADHFRSLTFTGDHVLSRITPSIGYEPNPSESPLARFLDSLRRIRSLPDARLLPAHGPIGPSVHERVDELLDHHETRLSATLAAVSPGANAFDVAARLLWTRREHRFQDLDGFNQMLAANETLAHLQVLQEHGLVDCADGIPVSFDSAKGS